MTPRHHTRPLRLLVILVLVSLALPAMAQEPEPAAASRLYLPQLASLPGPNVFGLEMANLTSDKGVDLMRTSGARWLRRNALLWREIEPEEGKGYRWDSPSVKALEADMISASQLGLNLVMIVRGSPRWATAPYQADCAPINPAKVEAFAKFMAAVAARYGKPPYNVRYWEIGNEPDAYIFPNDAPYGCWGVEGDPYYGGEAYGRMLKAVYPAIKQAAPNAQVLNGGLLLFRPYDPRDPTTLPGRFFEGVVRAGGRFDILSFHTYIYYAPGAAQPYGPPDDWRVAYLRDIQRRYGIEPRPMIRSESALLCPQVTAECRWAQADMVGRVFVHSLRDGLLANIWYRYEDDSFHNTALIEPRDVFVPRPAYFAYRHVARLLNGARYEARVSGLPAAVEAYRLRLSDGRLVYTYWTDSPAQVPFSIPIPAGAIPQCTTRDGGPLTCPVSGGRLSLSAGLSPQYVLML